MVIHNMRVGFATNSSSSHSVVILGDGVGAPHDRYDDELTYGWEQFVLASTEAKMRYLLVQMFQRMYDTDKEPSREQRALLARFEQELPGVTEEVERRMKAEYDRIYVDHQSAMVMPTAYDAKFTDAMITYFKSPKVVILGGNDNSDEFTLPGATPDYIGTAMMAGHATKLRVDEGHFVVFNRQDGTKVRLGFDPDRGYTKSSVPELVDLKITDYCTKGCAFCYQSSTPKGGHASLKSLKATIRMLVDMGVFEVAIGGGEPTEHPEFAEIIAHLSTEGIVPNFTTLSDKFLLDPDINKAVRRYVGGIGISCLSAKDLDLVRAARTAFPWGRPKVMAQHVLGSVPMHVTGEFLNAAFSEGIPVLLLGFKEVGFGAGYRRHDGGEVATFLRLAVSTHKDVSLSVDTALVNQYPDLPKALGAPDALVTSPEGKFSCYIDGVTGRMGASSYVTPEEMSPLPKTVDAFKALYATY